jgi:hypothetical protein
MKIRKAILKLLLHAARWKDVEKPIGAFLQLRSAHFKNGSYFEPAPSGGAHQ